MCKGTGKEKDIGKGRNEEEAETTTANAAKHAAKCMINVFGPE